MTKHIIAESPRRAPEAWRYDGERYQQLALVDGALITRGQSSTPGVFDAHRNVTTAYAGAIWRECTEAEALEALAPVRATTA